MQSEGASGGGGDLLDLMSMDIGGDGAGAESERDVKYIAGIDSLFSLFFLPVVCACGTILTISHIDLRHSEGLFGNRL